MKPRRKLPQAVAALALIAVDRRRRGRAPRVAGLAAGGAVAVVVALLVQVVLPTPPGVVFRTEHVLTRWMELHYVALNDALAFVTDRLAMRVHVQRAGGSKDDAEAGTDLAEVAGTVFRDLRRRAVASVPLTIEKITGITLSGAFLVERELLREFERGVAEVKVAHPKLAIELTGPWPPYSFVMESR